MNIAIINTLAKTDSTGKIAYSYQQYLKEHGHRAYLFYGRCDKLLDKEQDIIRVGCDMDMYTHAFFSRITGMQGVYSRKATKKMLLQFEKLHIDAVCLFNLHGYYLNMPLLFQYIGEKRLPCEYVMLDEYPFLGKCAYSYECKKFKTRCAKCVHLHDYPKSLFFDSSTQMFNLKKKIYSIVPQCVFVGVEYTVERAKQSAITKYCNFVVADEAISFKGPFYPRNVETLRKKLNIPPKNKVIVTVSVYPNKRKGSQYFLEVASRMLEYTNITFVHVGYQANPCNCPKNYIPVSYVKDQELLAEYYSLGDLFVQTSIAETVPSSIIEALACGTPILGFNASGIPFSTDKEHGTFVEPFNVDELIRVIKEIPQKTDAIIKSCREYANSRYNFDDYGRKLLAILQGDKV